MADVKLTNRAAPPRDLFLAPSAEATPPTPLGGGFGAPPPQSLGGMPPQGGMGGGMGAPPPGWQQAATLPPPAPAQQAFEGALAGQAPQGGMGGEVDESDPLDEFVNYHAQQAAATGRPNANLSFFDTLRQARDRDPEAFYLLLGSVATGDPDRVAQTAHQLRAQRQSQEAATQQQLMGVARERSQRRENQQYRAEDRADRQQFAVDQRTQAVLDRSLDQWSRDGSLERIEEKLGAPVNPSNFAEARRIYSSIKDEAALNKEKEAFAKKHVEGVIVPAAGRIKKVMESDPEYAEAIRTIDAQRKEMNDLRKENLRERTLHSKRVRAALAQVDPAMKLYINDLQRQLTEAENDLDEATKRSQDNSLMARIDKDGSLGYADTQDELAGQYNDANEKATRLRSQIDDALASIGAGPAPRPRTLPADDEADDDNAPGGQPLPPRNAAPAAKPKRDFSKIDALLGGP